MLHFNKLNVEHKDIIISLTSFPARINTVWMTIYCLFQQKVMPGHIILTLSLEDFPKGLQDLPSKLLRLQDKGLEIKFVKENLKPHKKYYYVMKENPNSTVITVDDDMLYRDDMLYELLKLHEIYPHAVCANTVSKIGYSRNEKVFLPYADWEWVFSFKPVDSHSLMPIGVNGVLYPPHSVEKASILFDKGKIEKLALTTDDLWLKCCELIANVKVCGNSYYCTPPRIPSTASTALTLTNTGDNGRNDIQWNLLNKEFNLDKLFEERIRDEGIP